MSTPEEEPKEPVKAKRFPTPEEILLTYSLYQEVGVSVSQWEPAYELEGFSGVIDAFCVQCGKNSTFAGNNNRVNTRMASMDKYVTMNHAFMISLRCTRDSKHEMLFAFRTLNRKLIKIGQHPSAADLQFPELKKYRKILGEAKFSEFSKGIGLVSHGVGIGAFVYLRRIFEDLIEAAHREAEIETGWDEEQYGKSRMNEKITLLKSHLPAFLSENSGLYSILSTGIHALSEEECLRYFDAVKMGIEMILDEKLEQEARLKKADIAKKALSAIHSSLK